MRTRRSPRNQEILWRALGSGDGPVPKLEPSPYLSMTDEEIDYAYWSMSKTSRGQLKREAAKAHVRQGGEK